MNNTLRNMLAVVGAVLVGGGTFTLYLLKPGNTAQDAVNAGIVPLTTTGLLQCRVRVKDSCRGALPDGGYTRAAYGVIKARARVSKVGGAEDFVAFDLPDNWTGCLQPVGTTQEACQVLERGTCTLDATACGAAGISAQADACACSSGANCFLANGTTPAPLGVTLQAGGFTGAGCVSKYCGPEIAGEQGGSWPAGCP